jgi:hypothetical protein
MQRFQVSYNLKAVPEVQEYLNVCFENARKHGDLKDLYRRRSVATDDDDDDDDDDDNTSSAFSSSLGSRSLMHRNLLEKYDNCSAGQPAPSHNHNHNRKPRHHDYDFSSFALYIALYHSLGRYSCSTVTV